MACRLKSLCYLKTEFMPTIGGKKMNAKEVIEEVGDGIPFDEEEKKAAEADENDL